MNLVLFVAALLMTVVAMAFVTTPLILSYQRQNSGSAKVSLLASIVVFGFAIVLYSVIGKPQFSNVAPAHAEGTTNMQPAQPTQQQNDKTGSVTSLLAGLEARLAENPDDAKGWLLLAKSYDHLGRPQDARNAYDKAAALGMTDAELAGRLQEAAAAPAAVAEIRGTVRVAEAIAERVDPTDIVYIVAKTDDNPMPLAVLRRSATELPFDFVLSDANSMVQGGGISSAGRIVISVRLSKTGDALNTAAELGARSATIDPRDAADLDLIIDVMPGS